MNLTKIFGSKKQTQLVEYLLNYPNGIFNQAGLSRFLFCSPSTISRVIEPLLEEEILVYEQISKQMKIIALNTESDKVKALMNFYQTIKQL